MIPLTELTSGNLVYMENWDQNGKSYLEVFRVEYDDFDKLEPERLHPIGITVDLLEKNKFICVDHLGIHNEVKFYFRNYLFFYRKTTNEFFIKAGTREVIISSMHALQNLIKILGFDKIADNFTV